MTHKIEKGMTSAEMNRSVEITDDIVAGHGLKPEEYDHIVRVLGRTPNITELGVFSAMWNEHCSYKSSRKWLATLHTKGDQVICGPGENAGIVDIGDGQACVFKMESHNHPSYIEPYQGAATGVGGIMRDVFTMGARPVGNLNALRFGSPEHPKTRHLVSGVVEGIGGYGNCMGVPTVGGEVNFDPAYNGNILVNAFCMGIADTDKIFYSAASGLGNPVVYLGSKTGRDGIGGATMASAEFDEDSADKRPTVQVGDPFTEKLLLEACLELMETDAIISIQDMGAAGLTCSAVEMGDKGGLGIELNLDMVPVREDGMTAYEMLLSESQERMLMVLKPGREDVARAIFEKWELDFAIVGKTTDTNRFVISHGGEVVADLPLPVLSDDAPIYDRPWDPTPKRAELEVSTVMAQENLPVILEKMIGSAHFGSRRWVWEQYDHTVMGDTVQLPGGDAAVVRVHGSNKGLAASADVTPRYCFADPEEGGKQAVVEVYRNLTATGAKPLALTDCLNFGNPEKPAIMGQLVGAIQGIGEACRRLDFPIVSGNVSLYNETNGEAILPTPALAGVGLIEDLSRMATLSFKSEGDQILLIGKSSGHLGCSRYLRDVENRDEGTPPPVDLDEELKNGDFVRNLIKDETATAVHDIADGGLYVALAEMAMAGGLGCQISISTLGGHSALATLFGEEQARYIVTVPNGAADSIRQRAQDAGVSSETLGTVTGDGLSVDSVGTISIDRLKSAHENWFPSYMAAE